MKGGYNHVSLCTAADNEYHAFRHVQISTDFSACGTNVFVILLSVHQDLVPVFWFLLSKT